MARKTGQNGQELRCFMGRKQCRVKGLRSKIPSAVSPGSTAADEE